MNDFIRITLVGLSLLLAFATLGSGWPGPLCALAALLWLFLRLDKRAWQNALGDVLAPVALGFGAFAVAGLVAEYEYQHSNPDSMTWLRHTWLASTEDWLVTKRGWLQKHMESWQWFAAIVASLSGALILARRYPMVNWLSAITISQKVASFALTLLIAATTFSYFLQSNDGKFVERRHNELIYYYHAALRTQWDTLVPQVLAATVLDRAMGSLTNAERQFYQRVLDQNRRSCQALNLDHCISLYARTVAFETASAHREPVPSPEQEEGAERKRRQLADGGRATEVALRRLPTSMLELEEQEATVAREQDNASKMREQRNEQAKKTEQAMLAAVFGQVIPLDASDWVHSYIAQLVDALSGPVAEDVTEAYRNRRLGIRRDFQLSALDPHFVSQKKGFFRVLAKLLEKGNPEHPVDALKTSLGNVATLSDRGLRRYLALPDDWGPPSANAARIASERIDPEMLRRAADEKAEKEAREQAVPLRGERQKDFGERHPAEKVRMEPLK